VCSSKFRDLAAGSDLSAARSVIVRPARRRTASARKVSGSVKMIPPLMRKSIMAGSGS
jgi:hypothetical protein